MKSFPTPVIILLCLAVLVLVAQPFVPYGNDIRPGLGGLMNGVAGLVLVLAALIWAIIARRRR